MAFDVEQSKPLTHDAFRNVQIYFQYAIQTNKIAWLRLSGHINSDSDFGWFHGRAKT